MRETYEPTKKGGITVQPTIFNMLLEFRYPYCKILDYAEILNILFSGRFQSVDGKEELMYSEDTPNETVLRLGAKRLTLSQSYCPDHGLFERAVTEHLTKVFSALHPPEIYWLEVRGHHLYPIDNSETFFEMMIALQDFNRLEFSDLGVSLRLQEENCKINILYRSMERQQAQEYFHLPDGYLAAGRYLTVDIDIGSDELLVMPNYEPILRREIEQVMKIMKQKLI